MNSHTTVRCQNYKQRIKEQKIVQDFIICHDEVEQQLDSDVDHLLWLEDDVILMENFFSTLSSILAYHRDKLTTVPWLDLKLYLNPRLRGKTDLLVYHC